MTDTLLPVTRFSRWKSQRLMEQVEALEAMIVPPDLDVLHCCLNCAGDFTGIIYAGWYQGVCRYPLLCSDCAATWVERGGRAVVRWVE